MPLVGNRPLRKESADLDVWIASHCLNDCSFVASRRIVGIDIDEAAESARLGRVEGRELIVAAKDKKITEGGEPLIVIWEDSEETTV